MDLFPIWYHDRYWLKVFISTISFHDPDLDDRILKNVKVFIHVFKTLLFPNLIAELIHLWFDEYFAHCNPPNPIPNSFPGHVKIKVTNLEFSRNKVCNIRRAILSGDKSCLWELPFRLAIFCEILSHCVRYGMYAFHPSVCHMRIHPSVH